MAGALARCSSRCDLRRKLGEAAQRKMNERFTVRAHDQRLRAGLPGGRAVNVLFLSQIVPYPPHGGVLQRGFNRCASWAATPA